MTLEQLAVLRLGASGGSCDDQQLTAAAKFLKQHNAHFQPGVNEDLAATACWGTAGGSTWRRWASSCSRVRSWLMSESSTSRNASWIAF